MGTFVTTDPHVRTKTTTTTTTLRIQIQDKNFIILKTLFFLNASFVTINILTDLHPFVTEQVFDIVF